MVCKVMARYLPLQSFYFCNYSPNCPSPNKLISVVSVSNDWVVCKWWPGLLVETIPKYITTYGLISGHVFLFQITNQHHPRLFVPAVSVIPGCPLSCGPASWRASKVSLKADQKEWGTPGDVPKWPCGCSSCVSECFFMTSVACVSLDTS